jgi:hypothetical protein
VQDICQRIEKAYQLFFKHHKKELDRPDSRRFADIVISNKYETLYCTISTNNFIKRCARRRIHFSSL